MSNLPGPEFWALVHPYTGDVARAERPSRAFDSDVTAMVESDEGRFFIKAMHNRPGGRRESLMREKAINPFVRPISPPLLWDTEDDAWVILGFDLVEGRHADFSPASGDLPRVVGLLDRIGDLVLPEVAREWAEDRWDWLTTSDEEVELLRGDSLIYGDIHPANFLLGERDAWAVDWSWPTRGAGFIDPATLVTQLIGAGHSPQDAEGWVDGCRGWADADPRGIDTFAAVSVRLWRSLAERNPEEQWIKAMTTAAQSWADHRGIAVD
ncbi:protein kinase [Streptomyces sp. NPDC050560]|uniref:protein kinase n=1 Tax=Streptomyces sp. NPDC050560 TaxID=3365630 RepID=UPI00379D1BAE